MNDGHWAMLAGAIVEQAMKDYRLALSGLKKKPNSTIFQRQRKELEDFFRSQWYRDLTNIDGEKLMHEMQEEYL